VGLAAYCVSMPPLPRQLLPPVLAAVLALAVAVPTTWYVATNRAGADPAPATLPSGPTDFAELRSALLAQLPGGDVEGAAVLEAKPEEEAAVGLPAGRYRVHLICGLLRQQGDRPTEPAFHLGTPQRSWRISLPCPSTPLTLEQELDFTGEPAGAVSIHPEYDERRPPAGLVLLRFVPVTGEREASQDAGD